MGVNETLERRVGGAFGMRRGMRCIWDAVVVGALLHWFV